MSYPRESAHIPIHGTPASRLPQHLANQNVSLYLPSPPPGEAAQATSSTLAASSSSSSPHRIRRRNRMITSCLECRRRKLKCDKLHPCTNCAKFVRDCVFLAPALDSASQLKLTEIKEKMGVLERGLEVEVAKSKRQQQLNQDGANASVDDAGRVRLTERLRKGSMDLPGELLHEGSEECGAVDGPDDEKDLEPTPLAVMDAAYDDDADDDMLDLGVKMGKMRMTERLGGYFRPKMTEELSFTLNLPRGEGQSPDEIRVPIPPLSPSTPPNPESAWKGNESFLDPGPTYIAPGSGFFFGNIGNSASLIDFLPSRVAGDRLLEQYHTAVHFIARVVHWPSFQTQYDHFWESITGGFEPPGSLQAIVFAVMFSAVVSMSEEDITTLFSLSKRRLLASFQTATEVALGKANFLRTTKLETLQALVIYLIPMCRNEMSRVHSVLVGTAIRLAECMGLHRDPQETYGLGPLESHVRRTLWCQLCFLDIRTAEAQGPRPLIRRDDFDSSFPLNVNDVDFASGNPQESTGWTDMTFSKIRFECNEMHRVIWVDRNRLEKKTVTLTHVLGKIESFRKAMEAKYHPILDEIVPLQKAAKLVMNLLLLRMHVMVLHRYHHSLWGRIPDRLRQIILATGTEQMEDAVKLDTDPMLQTWAWYGGAYQQWHTAFLLLVEVFSYPMRREADRIWRILDYVFEPDPSMTREEKGRSILSMLRDRTGAYRDYRKIRAPLNMISRINATPARKPDGGGGAKIPLDFNDDPTPPATRLVSGPQLVSHPPYGNTEYPNIVSAGHGNLSPTSSNNSHQSQFHGLSPYNSSYAVSTATGAGASTAASLGRMTEPFADAPSPVASANQAPDGNWTFEAPSSFFMPKPHTNLPRRRQLPGESSQGSPPTSDATGSPEAVPNPPMAGIMAGQNRSPDLWTDQIAGGDGAYSMPAPQGMNIGGNRPGVILPPNSGESLMPMKGMMPGYGQQAGPVAAVDPDMKMVEIDWGEWDKIFPPNVNTGILNSPPIPKEF